MSVAVNLAPESTNTPAPSAAKPFATTTSFKVRVAPSVTLNNLDTSAPSIVTPLPLRMIFLFTIIPVSLRALS